MKEKQRHREDSGTTQKTGIVGQRQQKVEVCKRRLNLINLSVMQLWQVGPIMQHKGKTNRLYLRRLAIIYYAHSYHRTNNCGLTGATDSVSQQTVIYIRVIYHAWRGSTTICFG